MLAGMGLQDFAMIIGLIAVFAGGSALMRNRPAESARLRRLEQKIDAILQHLGIQLPDEIMNGGLSAEVRQLADAGKKIEAIKVHREQTGVGLKEAKEAVEAYLGQ